MKGSFFWRFVAVVMVVGIFVVAYGILKPGSLPAPSFSSSAYADEGVPATQMLNIEQLKTSLGMTMTRAKVPGGWFVSLHNGSSVGLTFYPDAKHEWNGSSLTTPAN